MATDPTRRIRARHLPNPFGASPDDLLETLSHLPAQTSTQYLTVSVDWRVEGSAPGRSEPQEVRRSQSRSGMEPGERQRPALTVIERDLGRLLDQFGPRGEIFESLTADRERILAWLQDDLDPAAQGALIVANHATGVFEAVGLSMPLETRVIHAPTPSLYKLVRLVEDNPTYAVLLADQTDARLSFIAYGQIEGGVDLEGSGYPRRTQQGGWSQRRYQARADERVEAFARDVANEIRKALAETNVDVLILAGDEVIMSPLTEDLHQEVAERVVDTIRLDIRASDEELVEATLPIAQRAEREREAQAVTALRDAVGADNLGVAGTSDTIRALQAGQVHELLMVDSFAADGWADFTMDVYGDGPVPAEHPLGGDVANLAGVDLRDEMIRLAIDRGGEVEIVHTSVDVEPDAIPEASGERPVSEAAAMLKELGGIGARLRFSMYDSD